MWPRNAADSGLSRNVSFGCGSPYSFVADSCSVSALSRSGMHIVVRAHARRALRAAPPPIGQQLIAEQHRAVIALEPRPPADARLPHAQVVTHVPIELARTHELLRHEAVLLVHPRVQLAPAASRTRTRCDARSCICRPCPTGSRSRSGNADSATAATDAGSTRSRPPRRTSAPGSERVNPRAPPRSRRTASARTMRFDPSSTTSRLTSVRGTSSTRFDARSAFQVKSGEYFAPIGQTGEQVSLRQHTARPPYGDRVLRRRLTPHRDACRVGPPLEQLEVVRQRQRRHGKRLRRAGRAPAVPARRRRQSARSAS